MNIKVFTAFSGYDSQCLALDRLHADYPQFNYELVGWSEIDKHAIKAHNALYPQYVDRNYGDMTLIDWNTVPDFDLMIYSSPCQDFSFAGSRRGGQDGSGTRSSLLWQVKHAIEAKKPKYLLMENVASLVSGKFIKLFNEWRVLLQSYGYTNFASVLDAQDYGIPQHRERIFLVSVLNCDKAFYFPNPIKLTKTVNDILEEHVDDKYYLSQKMVDYIYSNGGVDGKYRGGRGVIDKKGISCTITANYSKTPRQGVYIIEPYVVGWLRDKKGIVVNRPTVKVANTLTAAKRDNTQNYVVEGVHLIRKLTELECFRLMGLTDDESFKIIKVVSMTYCYTLAGNSIVVDVLYYIFRQLYIGNFNKSQQTELF